MKKCLMALIALAATAAFAQAPNTAKNESHLNGNDQKFVKHAAAGGLFEVEAARVAVEKADNADVKEFAKKLQTDHQDANEKLSSLAGSKSVTLPTAVSPDHQKKIEQLNQKSGTAFDRAYVQLMLKDHPKDISLFERQAKSGSDAELKAFAQDLLPTLKEHLKMAQDLQSKLGATSHR